MEYNINEAVEKIQVGNSQTLRDWESAFKIEVRRNKKGHRRYSEENIEFFKQVKKYRDERGLDLSEIAEILNLNSNDIDSEIIDVEPETIENLDQENLNLIKDELSQHIEDRFNKFLEISNSYANASYKVGYLEAQLKSETDKTLLAQNNLNLSTAKYQDEINRLKLELDEKNKTLLNYEHNIKLKNKKILELSEEIEGKNKYIIDIESQLNTKNLAQIELEKKLSEVQSDIENYKNLPLFKRLFKT